MNIYFHPNISMLNLFSVTSFVLKVAWNSVRWQKNKLFRKSLCSHGCKFSVKFSAVSMHVHNIAHAWTINEPHLPYKTGLDVIPGLTSCASWGDRMHYDIMFFLLTGNWRQHEIHPCMRCVCFGCHFSMHRYIVMIWICIATKQYLNVCEIIT